MIGIYFYGGEIKAILHKEEDENEWKEAIVLQETDWDEKYPKIVKATRLLQPEENDYVVCDLKPNEKSEDEWEMIRHLAIAASELVTYCDYCSGFDPKLENIHKEFLSHLDQILIPNFFSPEEE